MVLIASMMAFFALPALATNHTGIDQWGHFTAHFNQMIFWLGQGQWSLAFYQADCTQDAMTKLLFVHGGVLWIAIGFLALLMVWAFRKPLLSFRRAV